MNKKVTMKFAMYESVIAALKGRTSLLDNSPVLNNSVNKLESDVKLLKEILVQYSADVKWITAERRRLSDEMLSLAFRLNKLLVAYGTTTGNVNLVNQFECGITEFMKGGFAGKHLRVNKLIQGLDAHLSGLTVVGVTQADYESLLAMYDEVESLASTPRLARTNKVAQKESIANMVKNIDRFIHVELDAHMLKVELIDREAFVHYKASKKLVHFPTKHRTPESSSGDQDDGGEE